MSPLIVVYRQLFIHYAIFKYQTFYIKEFTYTIIKIIIVINFLLIVSIDSYNKAESRLLKNLNSIIY